MQKVSPQAYPSDPLQRQKRLQALRESEQARRGQEAYHQQLQDPHRVQDPRQLHQAGGGLEPKRVGEVETTTPGSLQLQQPDEALALSSEAGQEAMAPTEGHQGLQALLANFGQFGNEPKLNELKDSQKVKEVQGPAEVQNHPKKTQDLGQKILSVQPEREPQKLGKQADRVGKVLWAGSSKSLDSKSRPSAVAVPSLSPESHRPGSKGAPKTDAPKPVGESQGGRGARPDQRLGPRLFQTPRIPTQDRVELSGESRSLTRAEPPAEQVPSVSKPVVPQPRPGAVNPLEFTRESFQAKLNPA